MCLIRVVLILEYRMKFQIVKIITKSLNFVITRQYNLDVRGRVSFLLLCNKYYHLSNLNQNMFIISQFLWIKNLGLTYLGPLLRSHKL